MKVKFTPPCSACGKRETIGNTDGMPNIVGFVCDNGQTINLCRECIIKLGGMNEEEKKDFFASLGV